jgi:UDP-N-acetyl-2-amino-2-deoxyglucuronate dehydrogenase
VSKIKFGIIGCGEISKKHIHAINNTENASLICVSDINRSALEKLSNNSSIQLYQDYLEMVKSHDLDVIAILTSSSLRLKILQDVSKFCKDFIIEKPLALSVPECEQILKYCESHNINLSIIKQNRYNQPIRLAKKLLDEGHLGEVFMSSARMRWSRDQTYYNSSKWRGTWKHDGGALTNQAIHFIDMLCWFNGEPESVYAMTKRSLLDIETEDTGLGLIKFSNGSIASIEASTAIRPDDIEGCISLFGSKGSIEIGGFAMNKLNFCKLSDNIPLKDDFYQNPNEFAYSHSQFYKSFMLNFLSGRSTTISPRSAFRSIKVINGFYVSADLKKEISLKDHKLLSTSKLGV